MWDDNGVVRESLEDSISVLISAEEIKGTNDNNENDFWNSPRKDESSKVS
jgi:hypothetical protein